LKDEDYNVYLRKAYDFQCVNILYRVQIRSAAKSVMCKYFEYCDKNKYEIFYCSIDSILIKEMDFAQINRFISKEYGDLKIDGRYNKGCVIVSQGKFILKSDDKEKIRNMISK
jgi:hypothetical protein